MDVRTEAARFASERITRTAENKDGFRQNSENRERKKEKKNKRTQEDANGGIVDLIVQTGFGFNSPYPGKHFL